MQKPIETWSVCMIDLEPLREWFLEQRRWLPWRLEPRDPYHVLVSEIMLQQTRAEVVGPFFQRWMKQFPTVQALAQAPWEEVLKAWEGLGYYSRARRLHLAAQKMVEEHRGQVPQEEEALSRLPGCGPYTVGAVRAFAFKQRAAAVDGNVLRVWSRLTADPTPIDRIAQQRQIRKDIESQLPQERPWQVTEALIELGALVCIPRRPRCAQCPLKEQCKAFAQGQVEQIPVKRERHPVTLLRQRALLAWTDRALLLVRGEVGEVFGEIWRLPTWEETEEGMADMEAWTEASVEVFPLQKPIVHCYTRFRCELRPFQCSLVEERSMVGGTWVCWTDLPLLTLASGHREILARWMETSCSANAWNGSPSIS
ncbi:MAG: A/G-specific adenine glycosylase [Chlamydiia bacterium]